MECLLHLLRTEYKNVCSTARLHVILTKEKMWSCASDVSAERTGQRAPRADTVRVCCPPIEHA